MAEENCTGGRANLNGVHYQLLRSLWHAARILQLELEPGDMPRWSRLVLEPAAGGDVLIEQQRGVLIEQVKTRQAGTWALKEIIDDVLPDLFKAFSDWNLRRPVVSAAFITNGKRGNWKTVESLFRGLPPFGSERGNALELLDNECPLRIRAKSLEKEMRAGGFEFTLRGIFGYISFVLGGRTRLGPDETRRVWEFLRVFSFEQVAEENLKSEIGASILRRCPRSEDRELVLLQLLGDLLEQGRVGAVITTKELLAKHRLANVDISDRKLLCQRAKYFLKETLLDRGYDAEQDVRATCWVREGETLSVEAQPLVFVGESGRGKSWALGARALELANQDRLVLLVEAASDLEGTRDRAARAFCNRLWDIDNNIPLDRIHQRIRSADPRHASSWLYLLIDGIRDMALASSIVKHGWHREGIALTISLTVGSETDLREIEPFCRIERISDFSDFELAEYLHKRLSQLAAPLPIANRSLLRRPLLARLYCDLRAKRPSDRQPASEFDLLEEFWSALSSAHPLAIDRLARLAAEQPADRAYPWTSITLDEARLGETDILALIGKGLLTRKTGGGFELFHDHLLSWAMAKGWALNLRDGRVGAPQLLENVKTIVRSSNREGCWGRRWLARSLWFLFWVLLEPPRERVEEAVSLALLFEYEMRTGELVGLGDRGISFLFKIIREKPRRSWWAVEALQTISSKSVASQACELLKATDVDLQVAAAEILTKNPTADALDDLWSLRCEMEVAEPKRYNDIYYAVDEALASCGRLDGDWLRRRLRAEGFSREPVQVLVYLLPQIEQGRALWFELKEAIFAKVCKEHERCIAVCLESFRDTGHLDWLKARVNSEGTLGGAARRALFLLEKGRQPEPIEANLQDAAFTSGWWLLPHVNSNAAAVEELIAETIRRAEDPWAIAWSLLNGFESRVSAETLDLLLDSAAKQFDAAASDPGADTPALRAPLNFLAKVRSQQLLERFALRRGTSLEKHIVRWFCLRQTDEDSYHDFYEGYALRILKRVSGEGLTAIGKHLLQTSRVTWMLLLAIEIVVMRPDEECVRLLGDLAVRDRVDDSKTPIVQRSAIGALVELGRLDLANQGVLRWGERLSWSVVHRFRERKPTRGELGLVPGRFAAPESAEPAAVIAAGLGGYEEHLASVREILRKSEGGSDLARACVLALSVSGDDSSETVLALADQIMFPETEWAAAEALIRIGTEGAFW
ncbi:MAG: hypothetical protein HC897_05820 [Thermoanaerobaculia bacterium]|nr:hypothetical protein [Thermoanaerobaculia bacterium]